MLRDTSLERNFPVAYRLGVDRADIRLSARRKSLGVMMSADILRVTHGPDDYAWLDGLLGRPHRYEEGAAFMLGFIFAIDLAWDGQCELEG